MDPKRRLTAHLSFLKDFFLKKTWRLKAAVILGVFGSCSTLLLHEEEKPVVVRFRYSLKGTLADRLQYVVESYNKGQKKYLVMLEYGGDYRTSYTSTFSETDIEKRPHLLMVAEFNTLSMQRRKNDYIPLYKILDVGSVGFVPAILSMYSFKNTKNGHHVLFSLPFNCSSPVVFYNKRLFAEAGLPDKAPQTWEEVETYAEQLAQKKIVAFTTAWPAAYIFEHFSAVHNIPMTTQNNGFDGDSPHLLLTNEPFVAQLAKFSEWQQKGYYRYAGRVAEDAEKLFADGKVAMLLQGCNRKSMIDGNVDVGVGTYPYWETRAKNGPYTMNVGGTSIWVLAGHKNYEGVKDFLAYVISEEVQIQWHQQTNYLPQTLAAYDKVKKTSFYQQNPVAYVAVQQVIERKNLSFPNGIRMDNYGEIRERIIDAIEEVLLRGASAQEALRLAIEEIESKQKH